MRQFGALADSVEHGPRCTGARPSTERTATRVTGATRRLLRLLVVTACGGGSWFHAVGRELSRRLTSFLGGRVVSNHRVDKGVAMKKMCARITVLAHWLP